MTRIFYSAKYYIHESISALLGLTISIISLFILDKNVHWLVWMFYGIFCVLSVLSLFFLLWDIQWIDIDEDSICARNVFGTIKRIQLSKIRAMKVLGAYTWGIKTYSKYYSCIVISSRKKINVCDVKDSYNHKKSHYITFPYTYSNMQKLTDAYKKVVGREITTT